MPVATTLSWKVDGGRGTRERDCPWLLSSPPPKPRHRDEAAQRTCVGLLSYYTWATPVTVKATPSAVSTSSQRGCNVIISREILPRNAKQGHGSGSPGPGARGESNTSLLRLGWARGPAEEGGKGALGVAVRGLWGDGWEGRAAWVQWLRGSGVSVLPTAHVLCSHEPGLQSRETE